MKIKQNDMLELNQNHYYSLYHVFQHDISFISSFLNNAFDYIDKDEIIKLINSLSATGCHFNHIGISKDNEKNLIYINEEMIVSSDLPFTQEEETLNNLFLNHTRLELCQKNLIECSFLSQDNCMSLVVKYDALYTQKVPYILLYQDDNNWYDFLPFETEEAMNQFATDHMKQKNNHAN